MYYKESGQRIKVKALAVDGAVGGIVYGLLTTLHRLRLANPSCLHHFVGETNSMWIQKKSNYLRRLKKNELEVIRSSILN